MSRPTEVVPLPLKCISPNSMKLEFLGIKITLSKMYILISKGVHAILTEASITLVLISRAAK